LFQRFTERARRSIFFARYEASRFGTPEITSEQLLLGMLHEDKVVALLLGIDRVEAMRKEIESRTPRREAISTSVDLPVGEECQRALKFAVEEADALYHKSVGAPHLALGLLRVEESLGAKVLQDRSVDYQRYRALVEQASEERQG
jgi:ATP-dependent Clp protease ATP-binding subunit ClpC